MRAWQAASLPDTHPRFDALLHYLRTTDSPDPGHVHRLVNVGETAVAAMRRLSDRITYRHGQITDDGHVLDDALSRRRRMLRTDDQQNHRSLVPSWTTSPSTRLSGPASSCTHGCDRDDHHQPDRPLHRREGRPGHPGQPGPSTPAAPRSTASPTPDTSPTRPERSSRCPCAAVSGDHHDGCSTGLHIGTWSYASTFGGSVRLTVDLVWSMVSCRPGGSGRRR